MKLIQAEEDKLIFQLTTPERQVFTALLSLYPVLRSQPPQVSRHTNTAEMLEEQELLIDALTAQRRENKRLVDAFLGESRRFQAQDNNWRLQITPGERDWLLQVLNDIRIGSWLLLGAPDSEEKRDPPPAEENLRLHWTLEVCGFFQMALLNEL